MSEEKNGGAPGADGGHVVEPYGDDGPPIERVFGGDSFGGGAAQHAPLPPEFIAHQKAVDSARDKSLEEDLATMGLPNDGRVWDPALIAALAGHRRADETNAKLDRVRELLLALLSQPVKAEANVPVDVFGGGVAGLARQLLVAVEGMTESGQRRARRREKRPFSVSNVRSFDARRVSELVELCRDLTAPAWTMGACCRHFLFEHVNGRCVRSRCLCAGAFRAA
jgi:hypothetical protein